jgi:hypothetical protein
VTVTAEQTTIDPRTLISSNLFTRLVARIVKDEQIDQVHAERIMDQTLGFLTACAANPGAGLSPSQTVDVGWHTFILHTREYAHFCQQIAGRFIHHTPNDLDALGQSPSEAEAIGATVAAMRAAGLPVDAELWLPRCDCSQCYAGCADDPKVDLP